MSISIKEVFEYKRLHKSFINRGQELLELHKDRIKGIDTLTEIGSVINIEVVKDWVFIEYEYTHDKRYSSIGSWYFPMTEFMFDGE